MLLLSIASCLLLVFAICQTIYEQLFNRKTNQNVVPSEKERQVFPKLLNTEEEIWESSSENKVTFSSGTGGVGFKNPNQFSGAWTYLEWCWRYHNYFGTTYYDSDSEGIYTTFLFYTFFRFLSHTHSSTLSNHYHVTNNHHSTTLDLCGCFSTTNLCSSMYSILYRLNNNHY